MPFRSEAQKRKFFVMAARGEISKATLRRWVAESFRPPCRKGWRHGRAKDMDPAQLRAGIKVEREHFRDARRACRTAVDHLAEDKAYYRKLRKAGL